MGPRWEASELGRKFLRCAAGILPFHLSSRCLNDRISPPVMKSEAPASHCVVRFDDTAVTCVHPAGNIERVSWDDLQEVIVQTTDAGLSFTDKSWILTGSAP